MRKCMWCDKFVYFILLQAIRLAKPFGAGKCDTGVYLFDNIDDLIHGYLDTSFSTQDYFCDNKTLWAYDYLDSVSPMWVLNLHEVINYKL